MTIEAVAGGISDEENFALWTEEGSPLAQLQGSLYVLAQGVEADRVAKAVRDAYYGEAGPISDAPSLLQGAIEASHSRLAGRGGVGVSLVCAAILPSGELAVGQGGDCRCYLYSSRQGTLHPLAHAHIPPLGAPNFSLPPKAGGPGRTVAEGDILILASGAVVEALGEGELATTASLAHHRDPSSVAREIADKARRRGAEDVAVLLVDCRAALGTERKALAPAATSPAPMPVPVPKGSSRRGAILGGALLFLFVLAAVSLLWWRGLFAFGSLPPVPTLGEAGLGAGQPPSFVDETPTSVPVVAPWALPIAPTSTVVPTTVEATKESLWGQVNELWGLGDKGDVGALQKIVSLLERLQGQWPDPGIDEKLQVARLNLAYRTRMQEVDTYWGRGDTSAPSVGSWSRVVEILEALYQQTLPQAYTKTVRDKLYSAHVNYGRALEAANRKAEARGNYQRAVQIDPSRPEADQALKRL